LYEARTTCCGERYNGPDLTEPAKPAQLTKDSYFLPARQATVASWDLGEQVGRYLVWKSEGKNSEPVFVNVYGAQESIPPSYM
jgi:hypothetical protein